MVKKLKQLKQLSGNNLLPLSYKKSITEHSLPISKDRIRDLAKTAKAIYNPTDTSALPSDWHYWYPFEHFNNDIGFMGSFVRILNNTDNSIEGWVIVVRGTVLSNVNNIADDIKISLNKIPEQMKIAEKYVRSEIDRIRNCSDKEIAESFDKVPIYIVGHSLGAVIASNIFALMGIGGRVQCVNFENPGSLEITRKYLQSQGMSEDLAYVTVSTLTPWIYNIQGDVNLINTWNEQWGQTYRILNYYLNPGAFPYPTSKIPKNWYINFYYIEAYSVREQHTIEKICSDLEFDIPILKDISPFGEFGNSGYRAYLDYDKRKSYWDRYSDLIWQFNIDNVCESYKNEEEFINYLLFQLHQLHNAVIFPSIKDISAIKPKKEVIQISNAVAVKPMMMFSWLSNTISNFADYSGALIDSALDGTIKLISNHLKEVISKCPSYFPKDNLNYWKANTSSLMFSSRSSQQSNILQIEAPSILNLGK